MCGRTACTVRWGAGGNQRQSATPRDARRLSPTRPTSRSQPHRLWHEWPPLRGQRGVPVPTHECHHRIPLRVGQRDPRGRRWTQALRSHRDLPVVTGRTGCRPTCFLVCRQLRQRQHQPLVQRRRDSIQPVARRRYQARPARRQPRSTRLPDISRAGGKLDGARVRDDPIPRTGSCPPRRP